MAAGSVYAAPGTSMVMNVGLIVLMLPLATSACEYASGTQRSRKKAVSACLGRDLTIMVTVRLHLQPIVAAASKGPTELGNSPKSMVLLPAAGQAESATRRRQA